MLSLNLAVQLIEKGQSLDIKDGMFVKCGNKEKLQRKISTPHYNQAMHHLLSFLQQKIPTASAEEKQQYLNIAKVVVKQNPELKAALVFDRTIVKHGSMIEFAHPQNQHDFQKWQRNGMPEAIFQNHPAFCRFLETTGLMSQMKVTRDTILEIDGEAAITVNGAWMKWMDLLANFEPVYSKRYRETFIVHKGDSEVYTYLDNGRGLQPHHPYLTERTPLSVINEEEYAKVLSKAHEFIRPGEENLTSEQRQELNSKRTFIMQLVTSKVNGPKTRLHEFLMKPKHPYLRLIIGVDNPKLNTHRGEVYEIGYGWQKKVNGLNSTQGQFRSPDVWEYKSVEERVVTNVPITQEEAAAVNKYTMKYHRSGVNIGNPVGFHFTRQNCSSYVRSAFAAAGVFVPTEISLAAGIREITPLWLVKVADFFGAVNKGVSQGLRKAASILPANVRQGMGKVAYAVAHAVRAVFGAIAACFVAFINVCLGDANGEGGRAFVPFDSPPEDLLPDAGHWKKWLQLSSYRFNVPGVLQRWQRQQASTVIYQNPLKLAIVPPS